MDAMDFMIEPLFADVGDAAEGTSSSQGPVPRVVLEGVPVSDVNEHDKVRYNLQLSCSGFFEAALQPYKRRLQSYSHVHCTDSHCMVQRDAGLFA